MNSCKNLVIRAPNWIGDAVMATPTLNKIRQVFPNAHITVIATDSIAELLQREPCIDRFFIIHRNTESKSYQAQRIIQFLRKEQFDLGLLLTRSFSSAWQFFRGRVQHRIGFIDHFRRIFLTLPVPIPSTEMHDSITYQHLLSHFGCKIEQIPLKLQVTNDEKNSARTRLETSGHVHGKKLLIVNPGAAYGSAKCWPKEYFRKTLQTLISVANITCVCIGDNKSSSLIAEIVHELPHTINLANQTTIRELMGLLSIADCLLTNDSGPMHIGSALNVPLIALFGSTDPDRTGPLGNGKVIYKKTPCSPCFRRTCNMDFRCMYNILPADVSAQVQEILS